MLNREKNEIDRLLLEFRKLVENHQANEDLAKKIQQLIKDGWGQGELLEVLEILKEEMSCQEKKDIVLDVMDRVAGYCLKSRRLFE